MSCACTILSAARGQPDWRRPRLHGWCYRRRFAHTSASEEGGYVEVDDSGDAAVKYRAPVRLTALGGESMSEADRIIRDVLDTTGKAMGVEQREQMYASLRTVLNTLREM